jgi:hypothetical protein
LQLVDEELRTSSREAKLELGRRLELDAERRFDLGHVGRDLVGVRSVAGGFAAAAGGQRERGKRAD